MPLLAARGDLRARLGDDERVEAEGVLVDAAVGLRQRRRLAVGDHDDLAHVLALPIENPAREAQAFARVRVVRADADAAELGERNLLGGIVEQHDLQRVAGILRLDQLRERERDALGRREPILAVEDHAWLQSSISTVAHELWYSPCVTTRSSCVTSSRAARSAWRRSRVRIVDVARLPLRRR